MEANTIVGDSIFATEEERKETGEWSWGRGEAPLPADQRRRGGRDALVPRASSSFRLFFFLQGEKATREGWRWRRKRWRRWGMLPQSISSSSSSSWLSFFCGGGERETHTEQNGGGGCCFPRFPPRLHLATLFGGLDAPPPPHESAVAPAQR